MHGDSLNVFMQEYPADTVSGLQPGLCTKGFFLFSYIKRKLTEYDIPDRQSLKYVITHIFDKIRQEILVAVFETWINRLEWVMKYEGECFHQYPGR
jgi:hypothetical protein